MSREGQSVEVCWPGSTFRTSGRLAALILLLIEHADRIEAHPTGTIQIDAAGGGE